MSKYLIPIGIGWVGISILAGIIILAQPTSQKNSKPRSWYTRTKAVPLPSAPAATPGDSSPDDTVKIKAFVKGTTDDATNVSVEVLKKDKK
ncbi:MAG: hypothetical protein A2821_00875 [Candidatus Magasanikbacteria bacterium RIFCSPHIGHO2_01_FULL_41_23]|uniref:Uncharacterized protein n=1 Tax=Candidatus Magasanikbacteria bacterium RIFCSPLOWO2_01_FULL_40_15 TaxID=1798686 RepID=A0A1F6N0M8_9BACT|nr:MAG: hypothetical protein A2821_00875 [Candidatus Magasanikbacteria bacterium RIFCSPHIGHO2_01_FULL_41_23]OGH74728.1 MAG: hypothetical protein A3F22_02230 [Candidatus Magasanikbacteria bacterium RIFCSPHIGHO2_12_FULL_41_16]OGH77442.1 MAG: hypothetical protein A2983_01930 [Candidatus Magasanikbacteria bacterium RIFCSPLOWO2_01_FULL_40_15]